MLWLTFIHTFMGNRPKLADWSKLVCITPRSCLCSFLTSNWEVTADLSLNRFLIISQIVQLFVISSYIEGIETNLRIEKHTLRVFTWYFEQIVGKKLIRWFIYVFVSICCNSCHFSRFMLLNGTLWLTVTHAFKRKEPSWQTGPNESALHFKVVFLVCWHQIGRLVQVVCWTVSL